MTAKTTTEQDKQKRAIVAQTEFPNTPLEYALRLPRAIWENYAGKPTTPMNVAIAIDMKPTSGTWRNLCGSGIAYGLTEGGYNAGVIAVTPVGLRIVRPTNEADEIEGIREALLKPRIQREFFQRYDNAKFPKDSIAKNVLNELGLPQERADQALDIIKRNGKLAGVLRDIKGDLYVSLQGAGLAKPSYSGAVDTGAEDDDEPPVADALTFDTPPFAALKPNSQTAQSAVSRVFITHGKNTKILAQIEKIVRYGGFEAVVAKDHQTTAKPVPDKVLDDMRSCQAAVIHVGSEGTLKDENDELQPKINLNVIMEIGMARALYGNNFILLVEDGLKLPSNLQGLYECRYTGGELNMDATMKILESFSEFKKGGQFKVA